MHQRLDGLHSCWPQCAHALRAAALHSALREISQDDGWPLHCWLQQPQRGAPGPLHPSEAQGALGTGLGRVRSARTLGVRTSSLACMCPLCSCDGAACDLRGYGLQSEFSCTEMDDRTIGTCGTGLTRTDVTDALQGDRQTSSDGLLAAGSSTPARRTPAPRVCDCAPDARPDVPQLCIGMCTREDSASCCGTMKARVGRSSRSCMDSMRRRRSA